MQGSADAKMSGARIILWTSESVHHETWGQLQSPKYHEVAILQDPMIFEAYSSLKRHDCNHRRG